MLGSFGIQGWAGTLTSKIKMRDDGGRREDGTGESWQGWLGHGQSRLHDAALGMRLMDWSRVQPRACTTTSSSGLGQVDKLTSNCAW